MNNVIAEFGFDELAEGAYLQSKGGPVELRDHLAAAKRAEVAAVGLGGTFGVLSGQFGEIAAFLQLLQQLLGARLVFDENVGATDFTGAFGREETTHGR